MVHSAHPASIAEGRMANRHQTWGAGCDGRERIVGRAMRERTAKACGPGALVAGAKPAER